GPRAGTAVGPASDRKPRPLWQAAELRLEPSRAGRTRRGTGCYERDRGCAARTRDRWRTARAPAPPSSAPEMPGRGTRAAPAAACEAHRAARSLARPDRMEAASVPGGIGRAPSTEALLSTPP